MGGYVLIIDDEDSIRSAIADILETVGIKCIGASNGELGIQIFRERGAEIALVILDLSMPGLSGEQTLLQLQGCDANVRVVLSSGYSEAEATGLDSVDNIRGFLRKPYRLQELISIVESSML